jgi:hypothetical protein
MHAFLEGFRYEKFWELEEYVKACIGKAFCGLEPCFQSVIVGILRLFYRFGMEAGISVFGWGHTKNELLRRLALALCRHLTTI